MSDVIIFVDDASPKAGHYSTGDICKAIEKTQKSIKTIEINEKDLIGIRLKNSLAEIIKKINKINQCTDSIIGLCVDVVDNREKESQERVRSGIELIKVLKKDSETKMYEVIAYTTKNMEISESDEEWLKENKINVIRKDDISRKEREGGKGVYDVMAEKILKALNYL